MKVVYVDCSAGLSGSALLGALVDLGAKPELLLEKIQSFFSIPFQLNFSKIHSNNTYSTTTFLKVNTVNDSVPAIALINQLFGQVSPGDELRERLNVIFNKFIEARAKVAGLPVEELAMPKMEILRMAVLAAGFLTALSQLKIARIHISPLPVGFQVFNQDSAPLLLELARGVPVRQYGGEEAPITPLGVALLSCCADECGHLPEMLLSKTGYGASAEEGLKNVQVRLLYGTTKDSIDSTADPEKITVIETAIDDMNPEFFPFLVDRLLKGGAADAFLIPIYMKKGRPAHLLTVLCSRSRLEDIIKIIFNEATTLGVRIREDERRILPRYFFKVDTPFGEVSIKAGYFADKGNPLQYAPEFEDCKRLALQHNVPIKEVYIAAQLAACDRIKKSD